MLIMGILSWSRTTHSQNTCFVVLKSCNFIKKRLLRRCFLVNIAEFLKTFFYIEHLRRLHLHLDNSQSFNILLVNIALNWWCHFILMSKFSSDGVSICEKKIALLQLILQWEPNKIYYTVYCITTTSLKILPWLKDFPISSHLTKQ